MLTRIRNAQMAGKPTVEMPGSKLKAALANVLKDEGYISAFVAAEQEGKPRLAIDLKYYQGKPVIAEIDRVLKPGGRISITDIVSAKQLSQSIVSDPKLWAS